MNMRIFPENEAVENQIGALLSQIKHLRNGDTAKLISDAGALYHRNYGVMLVHLRQMGKSTLKNNELARRLWFREIRETMIIATLVALPEGLKDDELNDWGEKIGTVELAEQMALNLLGKREGSDALLRSWLVGSDSMLSYTAAMAIGWQFRFLGEKGFEDLPGSLEQLKELSAQSRFIQPVGHALKMAARYSTKDRSMVMKSLADWSKSENESTRQVAVQVFLEMEGNS